MRLNGASEAVFIFNPTKTIIESGDLGLAKDLEEIQQPLIIDGPFCHIHMI